eukprot:363322-Chlamydomonas_euryale.AAC.9
MLLTWSQVVSQVVSQVMVPGGFPGGVPGGVPGDGPRWCPRWWSQVMVPGDGLRRGAQLAAPMPERRHRGAPTAVRCADVHAHARVGVWRSRGIASRPVLPRARSGTRRTNGPSTGTDGRAGTFPLRCREAGRSRLSVDGLLRGGGQVPETGSLAAPCSDLSSWEHRCAHVMRRCAFVSRGGNAAWRGGRPDNRRAASGLPPGPTGMSNTNW